MKTFVYTFTDISLAKFVIGQLIADQESVHVKHITRERNVEITIEGSDAKLTRLLDHIAALKIAYYKNQYKKHAVYCPFCGQDYKLPLATSTNIAGSPGNPVEVNRQCPECYLVWTDFYVLSGVYGIGL